VIERIKEGQVAEPQGQKGALIYPEFNFTVNLHACLSADRPRKSFWFLPKDTSLSGI
jgi:hypothetical protein